MFVKCGVTVHCQGTLRVRQSDGCQVELMLCDMINWIGKQKEENTYRKREL